MIVKGDWVRLVKRNRWDTEHLRSHVGDLGQVTLARLAASPRDSNQVRVWFPQCQVRDRSTVWKSPIKSGGCVHWVSEWRCEGDR